MKITYIEKKLQVSDELKAYAEKKISKMDKFFRNETDATVTFSTERGRYRAEVTLHNNGMYYRVNELTSDMAASIDSACAAIERQIRKNKTRLEKRLRDGAFDRSVGSTDILSAEPEPEDEDFRIVRTKRFALKPMTPEEAILQMNLLEHEFFAFRNMEDLDEPFSVVYRRKNGGYGLISESDIDEED